METKPQTPITPPKDFLDKDKVKIAIFEMDVNSTRSDLAKHLKISQMRLADLLTRFKLN